MSNTETELNQQSFGEWLKDYRASLNLSQTGFARKTGIPSQAHLSKIEKGKRIPTAEAISKIVNRLGFESEVVIKIKK